MREPNPEIKPDWWLVKFDDRDVWSLDVQEKTAAVWTIYAFDRSSHTYCCEATPSYAMYYVASDAVPIDSLSDDERELVYDAVTCNGGDDHVCYMHARDVEGRMERSPDLFRRVGDLGLDEEDLGDDNKVIEGICEGWGTGALMY